MERKKWEWGWGWDEWKWLVLKRPDSIEVEIVAIS